MKLVSHMPWYGGHLMALKFILPSDMPLENLACRCQRMPDLAAQKIKKARSDAGLRSISASRCRLMPDA